MQPTRRQSNYGEIWEGAAVFTDFPFFSLTHVHQQPCVHLNGHSWLVNFSYLADVCGWLIQLELLRVAESSSQLATATKKRKKVVVQNLNGRPIQMQLEVGGNGNNGTDCFLIHLIKNCVRFDVA